MMFLRPFTTDIHPPPTSGLIATTALPDDPHAQLDVGRREALGLGDTTTKNMRHDTHTTPQGLGPDGGAAMTCSSHNTHKAGREKNTFII